MPLPLSSIISSLIVSSSSVPLTVPFTHHKLCGNLRGQAVPLASSLLVLWTGGVRAASSLVGLEQLWDSSLGPGFLVLPSPGIGTSVIASQKLAV